MGQKKLQRFAELAGFSNVLQFPENMAGNWNRFFKNDHPITLELACGKGEYALSLGRMHPERNYIGVDQKGNRLWVGAKKALQENLANVAFLRTQIDQLARYFSAGEVAEIWITFPDPQLRISRSRKRLTHPKFLRLYQHVMKPGSPIHVKTDSPTLYRFTQLVINLYGLNTESALDDVYANDNPGAELLIKTHYEALDIARSNRVHYIRFSLPGAPLPDRDKELKELTRETEADRGH